MEEVPGRRGSALAGLLSAAVALAFLPSLLLVGFGIWSRPAAVQGGLILDALGVLGQAVQDTGLPMAPWIALPVLVCFAGAAVGLVRVPPARPWARRLAALLEASMVAVGMVATLGIFAVAMASDRSVFWGALGVALIVAGPPRLMDVEALQLPRRRVVALVAGAAAALLAGLTVLEGPGFHSPVFALGEVWGRSPARHSTVGGGLLLLAGGLGGALFARSLRGRFPTTRVAARAGAALVVVVAVLCCGLRDPADLRLARSLSALGLFALAAGAAPLLVTFPRLGPSVAARLDPRGVFVVLLPVHGFAVLAASRGLMISLWTTPATLPAGIERLSARTGIFSVLAWGEDVYFTDRARTTFGSLHPTHTRPLWPLRDADVDAVEELGATEDGDLWMSVGRWEPEPRMGLMPIDPERGPGAWVDVDDCWIASWTPVPDRALGLFSQLRRGDVLLGCEGTAAVHLFRPSEARTVAVIDLDDDVESAVFHPDGESFYGISLWGGPSVSRYEWPSGERIAKAAIGPFNWSLVFDARGRLWASRFFGGMVLLLDPETLDVEATVPLSFGIRAMIHDPVHDRIWASAAYSGRLWEVDASPPHRRRVHALCGQGRDLSADERGRVVVATDCGIFRLDPRAMPPLGT